MNPQDNPFHKQLLEAAIPGQEGIIDSIMGEAYTKLLDGTFDANAFQDMMPKLIECIKPESKDAISQAMERFLGHITAE